MKIIEVPYIDQTEKYPTGCESISAVMLLRYLGYPISPEEFIDRYLSKRDLTFRKDAFMAHIPMMHLLGAHITTRRDLMAAMRHVLLRQYNELLGNGFAFLLSGEKILLNC